MKAEIGTPRGSLAARSITGHWLIGAVKRALGCAAGRPLSGVQSWPGQPVRSAGGTLVMPSHHTSPSSVGATVAKIVLACSDAIAVGLGCAVMPGATPKKTAFT